MSEKLSQITEEATSVGATDRMYIVQGGVSKYIDGDSLDGAFGGGALEYQTEITVNTTLDGTQKGLNKVYPVNNASDRTITITTGDYVENDVINIERRGQGSVEIIADTGVRIRGIRDTENRYFINDVNSMVALLCRGGEEFAIIGNLTRGYTGAVTTSSYGVLNEGAVGADIAVAGTGFSDNMLVSVSANATLNSFTVNSSTSLTLNLTAVGVETDNVTVTYDNGDVFVDTDAMTIAAATSFLYDTYPFQVGYALFKLKSTQTYGVRVRRDSDDAEVDVEFNGSNKIALDSTVSAGGDLTTWAGSDDVFIVKKYNQGAFDSTFDWSAPADTNEPQLLSAGALITLGSRTFVDYDGTDDYMLTTGTHNWDNSELTLFSGIRIKTLTPVSSVIMGAFAASPNRNFQFYVSNADIVNFLVLDGSPASTITATSATVSIDTNYQVAAWKNNSETRVAVDGVSGTAAGIAADYDLSQELAGAAVNSGAAPFNGYKDYDIVYTSDQSANLSAIETLISNFI